MPKDVYHDDKLCGFVLLTSSCYSRTGCVGVTAFETRLWSSTGVHVHKSQTVLSKTCRFFGLWNIVKFRNFRYSQRHGREKNSKVK